MVPSASTFLKFRGHVWSSKHVSGVGGDVGGTVGIEGAEVIGTQQNSCVHPVAGHSRTLGLHCFKRLSQSSASAQSLALSAHVSCAASSAALQQHSLEAHHAVAAHVDPDEAVWQPLAPS